MDLNRSQTPSTGNSAASTWVTGKLFPPPRGLFDTGHVVTGYQYFTMEGRIRRFPKYPKDYLEDIGLTWAAKNAKGSELESLKQKARPRTGRSFSCPSLITSDRKDLSA